MLTSFFSEIRKNLLIYTLLLVVIVGALYVRLINTSNVLGFYYDQGRDALVIWNFIHNHKLFLVGPTTGIAGIFRGPWYYWLILPFYLLGGGNPIWPANFLAITTVIAIFMLYILGKEIFDRPTGLIAATIASFSYYLIVASRWLSNPTPMLLISILLVWSLLKVSQGKKNFWLLTGFLLGMAIQFGSAAEVFYIPAVLIYAFLKRKSFPSLKTIIFSGLLFSIAFVPQIIFDFKHGGILSKNIFNFIFSEGSFKLSFWQIVTARMQFYWQIISSKIWIGDINNFTFFFLGSLSILAVNFKNLWKKDGFKIIFLLGIAPLIGMIFFQGNQGNVYDYYFTGYYLIFVLLFSIGLGYLAKDKFGLIFLALFFYLFFKSQTPVVQNYLVKGQSNVNLKQQIEAINWIYNNANNRKFNIDVYVPPVIPYAYEYLFLWDSQKRGLSPTETNQKLLYTLYEEDTPVRLAPWLTRQDTIAKIQNEINFRGLTVQERERIKLD